MSVKQMSNADEKTNRIQSKTTSPAWDHGSHAEFFDYYANESLSPRAAERFRAIRDAILRVDPSKDGRQPCDVADIGCGAGTQSMLWAELGHRVHGVDVNEPLLDLARERATNAGYKIKFLLGSAVSLPLPDNSMDVCMAVELLEHVAGWQSCVKEFIRVLRPGGVLFMSTTNKLCPLQQEFTLPLYSWYPGPLKRYCEKLAMTTRPQLANYAKYPAVNWFSYYGLRNELARRGFHSMDRFDLMDISKKGSASKAIVATIRAIPILRWFGHIATPGTTILAVKRAKD
jgi:2-polyprenyl-6-hydroxyphenyl methylase/3-demethylubiquinone-9 3-methyltransferase